eukprot:TRINITY_DN6908_c0_g1_i1.p1 TRINITY_DN6908_c0_g1~~TRINITY_DN6908_c0_g1_i1.p1  ORF type:complete len:888 (+),score=198.60 TRINITY_DN6908_c0_g1_i1:34-2697(+)
MSAPAGAGGDVGAEASGVEPETAVLLPGTHGAGSCEVLHLAAAGDWLLTTGGDGRLASSDVSAELPTRAWAQKLANSVGGLATAAVSSDGAWLAMAEETETGFQVWVHQLDAKGRVNSTGAQKPRSAGRFTLDVRHLSWHPTLPYLCMATDDGKVDVWWDAARLPEGLASSSRGPSRKQLCKSSNPDGSARCACFDPRGELVAAAFASGQLVIFNFQDGKERYRGQLWPKAVAAKERSERLCMAWHPSGEQLAVPGETSVRLLARANFGGEPSRLQGGHRFSTTHAAWSPSGKVLASASAEAVALWSFAGELCGVFRFSAQPCSLVWGADSLLAVGTEAGSLARLKVVSPRAVSGSAEDTVPAASENSEPPAVEEVSAAAPALEEARAPEASARPQEEAAVGPSGTAPKEAAEPAKQAAFQPGASSSALRRRYLAWNENGALKLLLPSSGAASPASRRQRGGAALPTGHVEVEYSRERGRSSVRELKAFEGLELGALGPGVCALASNPSYGQAARIVVHVATPWQRASFDQELPAGERVEALAVGRGFVAVFTSPHRLLRITSTSLMPMGTLAVAGDVVCIVACEELLLCITEVPGAKEQRPEPCLEFSLYGVLNKERLASGSLPLSPRSCLRWAGFSAEAQPLTLDSAGVLRTMVLSGGKEPMLSMAPGTWLPVAELEDRGAKFWPVRAEAGALHCAEVKAGDEPRVGGIQRLTEVRYKLPFGLEAELPERLLRQELLSAHVALAMASNLLPAPSRRAAREVTGIRRTGSSGGLNPSGDDGRQALRLFEKLTKSGDQEQALDVASHFLSRNGSKQDQQQREARLLDAAKAFAEGAGREELVLRLTSLIAARSAQAAAADVEASGSLKRSSEQASLQRHDASRLRMS